MRPTVLLFDVDGTLLSSSQAGRKALNIAFGQLHGRTDACAGFALHGMTDRAIVRRGLTAIGAPTTEKKIDAVLEAYLAALPHEVASADPTRYRALPGVVAAVDAALALGHAVGLGTGNVERGARIKLGRLALFERFAFGGYGSDHEDRTELIRIGAQRGAARLGVALRDCRVVVIGDTPHDLVAAQGAGAEALLVATGAHPLAELAALGPSLAVTDLASAGALDWLLGAKAR